MGITERAAMVTEWLTSRRRSRLDLILTGGLCYIIGAGATGTWWGRTVEVVILMGVTDMGSAALRRIKHLRWGRQGKLGA